MKMILTTWIVISLATVEALAIPDADSRRMGIHWFCGVPGAGCRTRSVDIESRPLTARQSKVKGGSCHAPGEVCATLRHSARAVRDALADHWTNYDVPKTGASALCNVPGGKCAIAREAIGDVSETAENAYHELIAREARHNRPTIYLGGATSWFCGVPGQGCVTKRSGPAINRRDAGAVVSAAKALNDADPEFLQTECFKKGNECHSLLDAHTAFHRARREAESVRDLGSVEARQAYCAVYGCDEDTEDYFRLLKVKSPETKQIEKDCFAEDGECTLAQRSLDHLERALDRAVNRIA